MGKEKTGRRSNRQAEQMRERTREIISGQPDGPVTRQPAKRGKGKGIQSFFNHKQRRR